MSRHLPSICCISGTVMWVLSINSFIWLQQRFVEPLLCVFITRHRPLPRGMYALVIWNRPWDVAWARCPNTSTHMPRRLPSSCPELHTLACTSRQALGSQQVQAPSLSAGACTGAGTPHRAPTGRQPGVTSADCLCPSTAPLPGPTWAVSSVGSFCEQPAGSPGPLPNLPIPQVSHTPHPGQPGPR